VPALPDPATWAGRRVLVTGHTGFKGAWLALYLHAIGAEVHGLATRPPTTPSLYELARVGDLLAGEHTVDVTDAPAVERALSDTRPEVVLHLAAQAIVRTALTDPATTFAVNVTGTATLLQHVPKTTEAIVVVTSDKCYRDVESGRPMTEDDPLGGDDPYSASKAAQELAAASIRRARDLPLATARAGNVIGGGDFARDRLIPDLVRAAEHRTPLALRNPGAVRPWQHVLNPLAGYLVLAEHLLGGEPVREAFNFGPDPEDAKPVRWLAERWPPPRPAIETHDDAQAGKEATTLRLDSTKAEHRLGWRPTWDLERGLAATAAWYRATDDDPRERTAGQITAFQGL
jgi:CDP-glucose 4,6-dehydratase